MRSTGRPRNPKPEPDPEPPALEGEVIEAEEEMDPEDTSTHLERWTDLYVDRLSKYIAGVLKVEPPGYAPDGAEKMVRRRHELNRRLQAARRDVMKVG